jgi:hypothetical protein
VEVHEVHYRQHVFAFAQDPGDVLTGKLLLDSAQRELLTRLVEGEEEGWYLDEDGQRLPAGPLFERSPWSCPGPTGPVKLLRRFLDLRDGRAMFSTPDSYGEGMYDWLQRR